MIFSGGGVVSLLFSFFFGNFVWVVVGGLKFIGRVGLVSRLGICISFVILLFCFRVLYWVVIWL